MSAEQPGHPPCVLHEQAVLACVMLDGAAFDEAMPLTPGHFSLDMHGAIWRAVLALHEHGAPLTPAAILGHMRPTVSDEAWSTYVNYVPNLLNVTPVAIGADYHADQVRQFARLRRVLAQAQAIAAYGEDDLRGLQEAERMGAVLAGDMTESGTRTQAELVNTTMAVIEERIAGKRAPVNTGLPSLTGANIFQPQTFVVLAARPSVGKSLLAYQMAQHASKHGAHGLFASLEMSGEQLTERALAMESGVAPQVITHAHLMDAEQWTALTRAAAQIAERALRVLDARTVTFEVIALTARRLKALEGLDFVVVDYVQLLPPPSTARNSEAEALTIVSRKLKALARELDVCVVGLSQVNRDGAGRRPDLTNLAGSDALGRDADSCLVLWPNADHGEDGVDAKTGLQWLILDVQKHRNGSRRTMDLVFNPRTMVIGEVEVGR